MKIVVIGGSGLIGSKTVERLRKKGHEVVAMGAFEQAECVDRNHVAPADQVAIGQFITGVVGAEAEHRLHTAS